MVLETAILKKGFCENLWLLAMPFVERFLTVSEKKTPFSILKRLAEVMMVHTGIENEDKRQKKKES
jgi:hypothetical protein